MLDTFGFQSQIIFLIIFKMQLDSSPSMRTDSEFGVGCYFYLLILVGFFVWLVFFFFFSLRFLWQFQNEKKGPGLVKYCYLKSQSFILKCSDIHPITIVCELVVFHSVAHSILLISSNIYIEENLDISL